MARAVLLIGVILTFLSLIVVPWRFEKTLTLAWQQELPEPNDLAGWKLYQSQSPGGPYTFVGTIPFNQEQKEYRVTHKITLPGGERRTLYFVLRAFDTSGNQSPYSNEVTVNLGGRPLGVLGYDFVWSKKEDRALNYARMSLQMAAILLATGTGYWFACRKTAKCSESGSSQENKKSYYCHTCGKRLEDPASAEVHRAFKHDVREIHEG